MYGLEYYTNSYVIISSWSPVGIVDDLSNGSPGNKSCQRLSYLTKGDQAVIGIPGKDKCTQ